MSIAIASVSAGFAFAAADLRWMIGPADWDPGHEYEVHDVGAKLQRIPTGWAASLTVCGATWPVRDWFVVEAVQGQLQGRHVDNDGQVVEMPGAGPGCGGVGWYDFAPPKGVSQPFEALLTHEMSGTPGGLDRLRLVARWVLRMAEVTDVITTKLDVGAIVLGEDGPVFGSHQGPAASIVDATDTEILEMLGLPGPSLADHPTKATTIPPADRAMIGVGNRRTAQTNYTGDLLSASDPGAFAVIDIASHDLKIGSVTVSYNSGTISALSYSTGYYVYADDAGYDGGAVTYQATTDHTDVVNADGRYFVGYITTPIQGGGSTGGAAGGGGDLTEYEA